MSARPNNDRYNEIGKSYPPCIKLPSTPDTGSELFNSDRTGAGTVLLKESSQEAVAQYKVLN